MKKVLLSLFIFYIIISCNISAKAYMPDVDPDPVTQRRFDNIVYKRATINTGVSALIVDFATTTSSVVVGTVNTNVNNYVKNILKGIDTVEILLDSAAAATLEVSIIGIRR